ncbi:alpha-ketoglutarate-dependent dioxygenase AlkB family protein [Rufibacter quisquiliarum]|uniref:Alkylated DNA repair dioxygenase AlkB n=1 Tax=Rufibacter quisquiliarum TaxID=1549639 RepID=A0A839GI30_9BACT|nr:alpha-ketoglutarate-dependent dioxygenase AlkB [Rufibacter quisquiliarum]MBA9079304.1 alkylated DNA repair dioxygenase AlkB [Rufibacter quisquiliarum]
MPSLAKYFREQNRPYLLPMPEAEVYLVSEFIPPGAEPALRQALQEQVAWRQEQITLFGRKIDQPRLTAWYADPGKAYTYSGLTWQPLPWLPVLSRLRERLQLFTGVPFNSVLLNLYRHGQDSMGWHSDDEPELGQNPVIASVSVGAERLFSFRHKKEKKLKQQVLLPSGSLLLMAGATQHHWQHQLAKTARVAEPRINLTFRYIA